jgi:hypothetical protein
MLSKVVFLFSFLRIFHTSMTIWEHNEKIEVNLEIETGDVKAFQIECSQSCMQIGLDWRKLLFWSHDIRMANVIGKWQI